MKGRFLLLLLLLLAAADVSAQQPVDLATAYDRAFAADPRIEQLRLAADETELRLRTIETEVRRPSLTVEGQAQYQSQVIEIPVTIPGKPAPTAPHQTYDGYIRFEQSLLDPTRQARLSVERARLAEAQARVRSAMYGLRQEVTEAFFTAALLQEREAQIRTAIRDLEARLEETRIRERARTATPGEVAAIEAPLLQRREELAELRANRLAAMARLSEITGTALTADDPLVIPDLAARFADARSSVASLRNRPELLQLARSRERLEAQKDQVAAAGRPVVAAYGRAGAGKPGFNFLDDELNPYVIAGVRVQWRPWDWGNRERERKILELQQKSLEADEEALVRSFERAVQNDLASVDRLAATAESDDRIVALRELIEREARLRFDEHVITAAEYVDKETDVLEARLLRTTHRLELAQARARVLTVLGVEIR